MYESVLFIYLLNKPCVKFCISMVITDIRISKHFNVTRYYILEIVN